MAKTLLIIGAGSEQIAAYQVAKARGLTIIGSDANANAPCLRLADEQFIVSTRDVEKTVQKALDYCKTNSIDGVMTIANDVPLTVASVAHSLNLPAISIEAAKLVSNKLLMKEQFIKNHVACPWFANVSSIQEILSIQSNRKAEKFVLKPVDGRGARGVLLIDTKTDINWAFNESKRWSDIGELILEEYIGGMQLSTESFIIDGKCYTPSIAERNYSRLLEFAPYIIEDGGTIPAPIDSHVKEKIDALILQGAQALGIESGSVKGDIVISQKNEPMIIELAGRLSGGWFATDQIPAATGINLVEAVMMHALGEEVTPEMLIPKYDRATAIRYWFPPEGKIHVINGEEKLKEIQGLLAYGFFRNVGEIQPKVRMHPDRFGYVIVAGKDRDEVLYQVEKALNCVTIEVLP